MNIMLLSSYLHIKHSLEDWTNEDVVSADTFQYKEINIRL